MVSRLPLLVGPVGGWCPHSQILAVVVGWAPRLEAAVVRTGELSQQGSTGEKVSDGLRAINPQWSTPTP